MGRPDDLEEIGCGTGQRREARWSRRKPPRMRTGETHLLVESTMGGLGDTSFVSARRCGASGVHAHLSALREGDKGRRDGLQVLA